MKKEDIKKEIESKKKPIQSDNPQVEITKLKIDAIKQLSDEENDIFSQLTKDRLQDETFDYALAITFARHPLRQLEERLARRGIVAKKQIAFEGEVVEVDEPIHIKVNLFETFLKEFLIRRHSLNRKRVEEYIEALDTTSSKYMDASQVNTNGRSILNRLG